MNSRPTRSARSGELALWPEVSAGLSPSIVNLMPSATVGGHSAAAEFPVHAVDDADGKLDHIAAGDLERDLRFDGEWLYGFDVADGRTKRPSLRECIGQYSE